MAVLDHEIHPRTQHGDEFRYGCWNLPRTRNKYLVKHRWASPTFIGLISAIPFFSRRLIWREIEDKGSSECRYDMSLTDNGCRDCKHRGSGEKYNEMVRRLGA